MNKIANCLRCAMKCNSLVWTWKRQMRRPNCWQMHRRASNKFVCWSMHRRSRAAMSTAMQSKQWVDRRSQYPVYHWLQSIRLKCQWENFAFLQTKERWDCQWVGIFPIVYIKWIKMNMEHIHGALSGRFKKMSKKLIKWTMNPMITTGSRPYFMVFEPSKPNRTPPNISPIPIQIPDKPTSCLADSPIFDVNPMLGLYTPL